MDSAKAELMLNDLRDGLKLPEASFVFEPEVISGGYDTEIARFRLEGVPERLSHPLVFRSFPSPQDQHRAFLEEAVHNVLSSEAIPVPKVHLGVSNPSYSSTPFLVMDYVPGETLLELEEPLSSRILGETHAALHDHNTDAAIAKLGEIGVRKIFQKDLLSRVIETSRRMPWSKELITWLKRNVPNEVNLSICHGDFHKLNILQRRGQVTGILDWSNFAILEPAFDVANTQISFLVLAKHLTAQGDFEPVDLELVFAEYLDAYRSQRKLEDFNLPYYLVLRSTMILFMAAMKLSKPYQHPLVVSDLCKLIEECSGVVVSSAEISKSV